MDAAAIAEVSTRFGCEVLSVDGQERFLLTHRKIITGRLEPASGGDKCQHSFNCIFEDQEHQILADLKSTLALDSSRTILLEVNGVHEVDGQLTTMHPKVVDWSEFYDIRDDLSLIVSSRGIRPSTQEYSVYKTGDDAILQIQLGDEARSFRVRNFAFDKLNSGRRFLAVSRSSGQKTHMKMLGKGRVIEDTCSGSCIYLNLDGTLKGIFRLRPSKISGRNCFTFSRGTKHV